METKNISCLIIDDDEFARETLQDFLSSYPFIEVMKSINDSKTAIKYITTLKPDLVFLDINMPSKNGLSVMNEIIEMNIPTEVIFVTAHQEYLMDALRINAFDYIIKPINREELNEAIERFSNKPNTDITQTFKKIDHNKIALSNAYGTIYIKASDISYIQADGCYTKIHLIQGKAEIISKNIGRIENLFPTSNFYRINRSVIINLEYISKIDRLKRIVHLDINKQTIDFVASKERLNKLETLIQ